MLANFEFAVNGTVSTREMLKFAENEKENCNGNPLTSYALGHIISNVWSEKVKVVKRGEAEQRIFIYLNLKRKTKAIQNPTQGGNDFESLVNFEPPAGWTVTRNNNEALLFESGEYEFPKSAKNNGVASEVVSKSDKVRNETPWFVCPIFKKTFQPGNHPEPSESSGTSCFVFGISFLFQHLFWNNYH